ncbi:protein Shroom3-like isoform X2 [Stegodyphus dumicola]|uniref:protein Shroom3-like isoform X2 n=1 Tax=Stegodyphus dumicola TaxID=202533 RepID=UPI0015AC3E38|nr:protein Shroom3-like isoform X2 [Stegodyphus dumicola]
MGERIEIVIKGGQPWGFRVYGNRENRSFVIIDEVELGGKAEEAGLKAGDHVIKINDVQCLSLADALQLIESAFRTLTVLIWRPRKCQQNVYKEHNVSKLKSSIPSKSTCNSSSGYCQPSPLYQNIDLYKNRGRNFKPILDSKPELSFSSFVDIHPDKLNDISRAGMEKRIDGCVKKSFSSADIHRINTTLHKSGRMLHKVYSEQQSIFTGNLKKSTGEPKYEQFSHIPSPSETPSNSKIDAVCFTKLNIDTQQVKQNNYGVYEIYSDRSDSKKCEPSKKVSAIGESDSLCCMYPTCHFKYRNCKIHSPPERDIPVPCKPTFGQSVYNLSDIHYYSKISYSDHKCNTISYSDTFQKSLSYSVINERIYENCSRFLESDSLKHPDSLNGFCESFKSVETSNSQFKKVTNMCAPDKVPGSHNHTKDWNLPNSSVSSPKGLISCDNDKISSYERYFNHAISNSLKKADFDGAQQNQCFGKKLVSENNEGDLSSAYQPSTCLNMEEIKSVVKKLPSNEKDEMLEELFNERTIDDGVQNVSSTSSSRSSSPVLPLPPPPPITESEIIPSDEPLPPPPPMSPVKDSLCVQSEDRKQVEAIYANLEMLRNQSLLVNSSTQTSTPYLDKKPEKPFYEKQEKLTQSISFGNEIFSNVFAASSFETELKNCYLRNILRSQFQSSVSANEVQILEGKGIIQRHNLNLPLTSAYFTTSEPKAKFLTRYHQERTMKNSGELTNKEEELIERLTRKLDVLRLERIALQEDIKQNDELGNSLASKLEKIAKPNEVEKFKLHVEELQKITNLLSSLSGRLARAENALLILPSDVSLEEKI